MAKQDGRTQFVSDIELFAENLISFIVNNMCEADYQSDETERSDEESCTKLVFNETMRKAVKYAYLKETRKFCAENISTWDEDTYVCIEKQLLETLYRNYEAPKMVLDFCVDVAVLAKMFKDNDLGNACNLAALDICYALRLYFVAQFESRWDSFNIAAKDVCENNICGNTVTPKSPSTHSFIEEPRVRDNIGSISLAESGDQKKPQIDYLDQYLSLL